MAVLILLIEGTEDKSNGNLREGFSILLDKALGNKKPRIIMGGGKSQTIDKFKNAENALLLCDLDAKEAAKVDDLRKNALHNNQDVVFYMIQEMEGWFLSQPEILDAFYFAEISKKLAKKHGKLFAEPDKELQKHTRDTRRKIYHKVNHGTQLLGLLDPTKLAADFADFKALVDKIKELKA